MSVTIQSAGTLIALLPPCSIYNALWRFSCFHHRGAMFLRRPLFLSVSLLYPPCWVLIDYFCSITIVIVIPFPFCFYSNEKKRFSVKPRGSKNSYVEQEVVQSLFCHFWRQVWQLFTQKGTKLCDVFPMGNNFMIPQPFLSISLDGFLDHEMLRRLRDAELGELRDPPSQIPW